MAFAEIPKQLQVCKAGDSRVRVTEWAPKFKGAALLTEPTAEDGDVVYMEFLLDSSDAGCAGAKADHLYSFGHSYGQDEGGVSMNLRGNVQFANGMCYFSGFFMNEAVMGMHQGWTETYFRPLDKVDVLTSGRYCAAGSSASPASTKAIQAKPSPASRNDPSRLTAQKLREMCQGIKEKQLMSAYQLGCASYVRGFSEGASLQAAVSGSVQPSCPAKASTLELAQSFVTWYDRTKPEPDQLAALALATSMLDTYPCQ